MPQLTLLPDEPGATMQRFGRIAGDWMSGRMGYPAIYEFLSAVSRLGLCSRVPPQFVALGRTSMPSSIASYNAGIAVPGGCWLLDLPTSTDVPITSSWWDIVTERRPPESYLTATQAHRLLATRKQLPPLLQRSLIATALRELETRIVILFLIGMFDKPPTTALAVSKDCRAIMPYKRPATSLATASVRGT